MKKIIAILFLLSFFLVNSQTGVTTLDNWSYKGNTFPASAPSNTFFFGTKSNHSLNFKTNNILWRKLDSIGISRDYTTAASSTQSGSHWLNSASTNGWTWFLNDATNSGFHTQWKNNNGGIGIYLSNSGGTRTQMGSISNDAFGLYVNGGTPAIRISTLSNVGIGNTTDNTEKLRVTGTFNATGAATIGGILTPSSVVSAGTASFGTGTSTFSNIVANGTGSFVGTLTSSNIVAGNLVTYNVKNYGLTGNGSTNDRAALNTLINTTAPAGSVIYFPPGTYNLNTTAITTDKRMTYIGDKAVITTSTNTQIFVLTSGAEDSEFTGFEFIGSSSGGNQYAIYFNGCGKFNVNNSFFKNLAGGGVAATNIENSNELGGTINNCKFVSNNNAVDLFSRGEYINILGCTFLTNTVGVNSAAGNFIVDGCNINYNVTGIKVITGTNNGHSIISNNDINHNTSYNLDIANTSLGMTISNNHIYQGTLTINNTTGVVISGGQIDATAYTFSNNVGCSFDNVRFADTYANTISLTGTSPMYVNCRNLSGLLATDADNFTASSSDYIYGATFPIKMGGGLAPNPADGSTYYLEEKTEALTNQGVMRLYVQNNITVTGWQFNGFCTTAASTSESSTLAINIDNSATNLNTAITFSAASGVNTYSASGLGINVNSGSYIEAKIINPTWATNPQGCYLSMTWWCQRRQ